MAIRYLEPVIIGTDPAPSSGGNLRVAGLTWTEQLQVSRNLAGIVTTIFENTDTSTSNSARIAVRGRGGIVGGLITINYLTNDEVWIGSLTSNTVRFMMAAGPVGLMTTGGAFVWGADPGGAELVRFGAHVNIGSAFQYRIAGVQRINTNGNYTTLCDAAGAQGIALGNTTAGENIHNADTHRFRSKSSGLTYLEVDGTGTSGAAGQSGVLVTFKTNGVKRFAVKSFSALTGADLVVVAV